MNFIQWKRRRRKCQKDFDFRFNLSTDSKEQKSIKSKKKNTFEQFPF